MTFSATNRNLPSGKKQALPPFTLTTRDLQMLHTIAQCTAVTAPQLSRLFFPPAFRNGVPTTHSNCQYRLKLLYRVGYVARYRQPLVDGDHRKPCLYVLAAKGAQLLASWLDGPETAFAAGVWHGKQLSGLVVDHLLLTNDVRLVVMQAVAQRNHMLQLTTWLHE